MPRVYSRVYHRICRLTSAICAYPVSFANKISAVSSKGLKDSLLLPTPLCYIQVIFYTAKESNYENTTGHFPAANLQALTKDRQPAPAFGRDHLGRRLHRRESRARDRFPAVDPFRSLQPCRALHRTSLFPADQNGGRRLRPLGTCARHPAIRRAFRPALCPAVYNDRQAVVSGRDLRSVHTLRRLADLSQKNLPAELSGRGAGALRDRIFKPRRYPKDPIR